MELVLASRLASLSFANVKLKNRIAYLLNTLSVVILLFCSLNYIVKHWFTVDKIIIDGQLQHITPVQLSYVAHNRLHGTFFTLDIGELKAEFEALPWVRQVSLKRHFPHTVVVTIEEYKAVARIGEEDLLALIAPIAMEQGLRFAIREGGRTVGAGVVAKILD